jgi:hypothetical protein
MIVTLCGSTRFESWFHLWNKVLSLAGHCVFGLGAYTSTNGGVRDWYTNEQKATLDAVHAAKIKASDAVLVLNPFAYIGESTLREIGAAKETGKQLFFLESWGKGIGVGLNHYEWIQRAAAAHGVPVGFGSPIDTFHWPSPWDRGLLGPAGERRSGLVRLVDDHKESLRS